MSHRQKRINQGHQNNSAGAWAESLINGQCGFTGRVEPAHDEIATARHDPQADSTFGVATRPGHARLGVGIAWAGGNDTDFALGSDAMAVAVQGYGLLKQVGRSEGLEPMRKALGSRFRKSRRSAAEEKKVA